MARVLAFHFDRDWCSACRKEGQITVETETTESTCISKHLSVCSSNNFTHFFLFAQVHVRRMTETGEWLWIFMMKMLPLEIRPIRHGHDVVWEHDISGHLPTVSFVSLDEDLLEYRLINTSGDTASASTPCLSGFGHD